ncbi:MAG: DNA-binding transcriptional regulator Fis [Gammaproteobacteria bacterium]|nr:MAG: DNA-binding transcriptional regulator Fis [Gammaproteobacteria bacterium]
MTVLDSSAGMVSNSDETTKGDLGSKQQYHTLRESVEVAMANYFDQLEGQQVTDLYELVISEVEVPLLEAVMGYTGDNQTKASVAMGLNRGTLRKKLKKYNML